jgi:hypothetical protein
VGGGCYEGCEGGLELLGCWVVKLVWGLQIDGWTNLRCLTAWLRCQGLDVFKVGLW